MYLKFVNGTYRIYEGTHEIRNTGTDDQDIAEAMLDSYNIAYH